MADEPAGWYLDASQTGIERYWDGSTWTDQTRQAMAPAPISGKTPTVIVWAFVLALIGFCGITALVGLVLGLLGRGRAKAAGAGVGLSTAAILISIGWLVLLVFGASRDLDAVSSQGPIAPTIASTGSVGATNAAPAPVGTCSPRIAKWVSVAQVVASCSTMLGPTSLGGAIWRWHHQVGTRVALIRAANGVMLPTWTSPERAPRSGLVPRTRSWLLQPVPPALLIPPTSSPVVG